MKVEQIKDLTNSLTNEILGKSDLVNEDLTNVVDVGTEIFDNTSVDNYVKTLVDKVGKVVFVNRKYSGALPSLLMDSWEYGSVKQKISMELPTAMENNSWNLKDGNEYKDNVFHQPKISNKFFDKSTTFEIDMSITDRQAKSSFNSANELNAFISMIYDTIDKALTLRIDNLSMRAVNNMIAETLHADYPTIADYESKTTNRSVNLLKLYNDKFGTTLTYDKALTDREFIRFASYIVSMYKDKLARMSTLFNIGGTEKFTSNEFLHTVLLSDFAKASDIYLSSDTYHENFVSLPNADVIPYWQGTGTSYDFASTSKIDVTTDGTEVNAHGIIGVMFDRDCVGVTNYNRRTLTSYNASGEFTNVFYKVDASYFNDTNENFVVFYV